MFAKVRKLRDDNNQPLFKHLSEEGPNTIHGKPVVISDVLPSPSDATTAGDPVLMFGDFERGCVLGYKGGIRIDRADSGVVNNNNLFETDRQAVRFVQRSGWVQVLGGTVAVLTTK
jgi:HK97 family phage major capsid protein